VLQTDSAETPAEKYMRGRFERGGKDTVFSKTGESQFEQVGA
jgi:hypothetical protein